MPVLGNRRAAARWQRAALLICALNLALPGCTLTDTLDQTLGQPPLPPSGSTAPAAAAAMPKRTPDNTAAQPAKPATTPANKTCGIALNKDKNELAQEFYVKGERLFGDDDIANAKAALQTATCLNPQHKQAAELLQLLKQTYPNR